MAYVGPTKFISKKDNINNSDIPVKPGMIDEIVTAQLVKNKSSSKKTTISAESVTLPVGVAGTTFIISLNYDFIFDASGSFLADKNNSSLSITSTAISGAEEEYDYELSPQENADAIAINGNYRVDYLSGVIVGKKGDSSTSATIDYVVRIQSSDANIGSVTFTGPFNVEAFKKTNGTNEDATIFVTEQTLSTATHLFWLGVGGYDRENDYFRAFNVNEKGVINTVPGSANDGYKFYSDTSFVVGDSPAVIDVNTDLGRNSNIGYIVCDGSGDILVSISSNGTLFGDNITLKNGETLNLDNMNVDSIRITHSGTDSAYRIFVR